MFKYPYILIICHLIPITPPFSHYPTTISILTFSIFYTPHHLLYILTSINFASTIFPYSNTRISTYLTTFNLVPIYPFLYLIHNEIYVTFPMTPLLRLLYTAPSSLYFHPNHVNLYHCLTFFPHHLPLTTNIPVYVQLSLQNINICIFHFSIFLSFFPSFLCFHINQLYLCAIICLHLEDGYTPLLALFSHLNILKLHPNIPLL